MKTIIIVQCRLSSTRLPKKALYKLDNDVLLGWALKAMKKVKADDYFVACDFDSEKELTPIAQENNFKIFAGSKDDVLDRFCKLIERENPDIVLRATADNPFLFFDAAQELLDLYKSEYFNSADYITYSGLPHGSGIELFNAHSLVKAKELTSLKYDHEHVGPALYNHKENFTSLFIPSPEKYNYPQLRTTIDTYADYIRCCDVIKELQLQNKVAPFNSSDVIQVLQNPKNSKKILFIPSIKKGQGTGHFRRCLELAQKTKGIIYIDENVSDTIDYNSYLKDIYFDRIIKKCPLQNEYDLIVCDLFKMTKAESEKYLSLGKTVLLDEGSLFTQNADYLLDIIPSILKRQPNFSNPLFIKSPINKKEKFPQNNNVKKILISFGGEDPANLTEKFLPIFISEDFILTVICNPEKIKKLIPEPLKHRITVLSAIPDLKEHLWEYDLVITHYGLTAFECVYSNTPVLLGATSKLHKKLSDCYGFKCISKNKISKAKVFSIIKNVSSLKPSFNFDNINCSEFSDYILNLAQAKNYVCPICQNGKKGILVERTVHHTFRKCPNCKMTYISFSDDSEKVKYEKSYFAQEYKNQYGKTYLEDFDSIKNNCKTRIKNIDSVLKIKNGIKKNVLDLGCAYGPFLAAAFEDNWIPHGSDIAEDAIEYVKNTLKFSATTASFTDINIQKEFGIEKMDAITMWYVIEHIKDLKKVLTEINKMLKTGGVFAFSTPNAAGLSRKVMKHQFFNSSPKDHYTLWELPLTQNYLKSFGFKISKIVATGIHPERIPFIKNHNISSKNLLFKLAEFLIKLTKNGDTYEVYCKKINGMEE